MHDMKKTTTTQAVNFSTAGSAVNLSLNWHKSINW